MEPAIDEDVTEQTEPQQPVDAVAVRSPAVPVTLTELAALKGEAIDVVQARVQVLITLRKASLRLTNPEDWLLFKAPAGQITGYLQDAGCERIRSLWGIEIYNVSKPERVAGADAGDFYYSITGDGRCGITRERVEAMEGFRASTDDAFKDAIGLMKDARVRKAARANLDGGIVRELTGTKQVPLEELKAAWIGTGKDPDRCILGRGFGTQAARYGKTDEPNVPPPICRNCKKPMVLRKTARGQFYSCTDWKDHGKASYTVDLDAWLQQQPKPAPASEPPPAAAAPPVEPLHADDIWPPSGREPGQEG